MKTLLFKYATETQLNKITLQPQDRCSPEKSSSYVDPSLTMSQDLCLEIEGSTIKEEFLESNCFQQSDYSRTRDQLDFQPKDLDYGNVGDTFINIQDTQNHPYHEEKRNKSINDTAIETCQTNSKKTKRKYTKKTSSRCPQNYTTKVTCII